jgi:hypothetical protein
MIKRWSTFNESNSVDNFKSEVEKIRSYFIEFEDINSTSYEMKVIGSSENDMLWSINPNTGNFDRWLVSLSEEANRYLSNEDYRKLFLSSSGGQLDKYPFCLCVNIKLKGEKDTKYYGSKCNISDDGVEMLQEILISCQRLKQGYDKVILDLNSSHSDYKPVTIKVYFNPISD